MLDKDKIYKEIRILTVRIVNANCNRVFDNAYYNGKKKLKKLHNLYNKLAECQVY